MTREQQESSALYEQIMTIVDDHSPNAICNALLKALVTLSRVAVDPTAMAESVARSLVKAVCELPPHLQ
jgi:hypothetical protein